jgi:hypothetical protein
MDKKYGIYISNDQVDYIMEFDYTDLEYAKNLGLIPLRCINNPNFFFDEREEAQKIVNKLNKLIKSNNYNDVSDKIDILWELLDQE